MQLENHARALATALARELDAREVRIESMRRLGGGAVQENWALDVIAEGAPAPGARQLVLRTDADSTIEASIDRLEEFQVLRAAWNAGVRVPEPLFACDDESIIGRRFYVMTRLPGEASAHRLVKREDDGGRLATELGAELARVHAIVPPHPGLDFLPEPQRHPALVRIETYRRFLDALPAPHPVLEWALAWLERRAPADCAVTLCHGDYRTGNYLVDGGKLTGILDWEFTGWGHPHEDIGWFCARCWRFARPDREAGGIGAREAFYAGYASVAGAAVDAAAIPYWEVMATVRWAVIALQQGERHLSGRQRSLELALTAHLVPDLERDLLDQIELLQQGDRAC